MNDADVNEGMALLQAAARGEADIVIALLDSGADINAQDGQGMTALMHAVKAGHTGTVRVLLERGADANIKGKYLGYEAIVFAVKAGNAEVVELLLRNGVDGKSPGATFALGVAKLTGNARVLELLEKASSGGMPSQTGNHEVGTLRLGPDEL